MSILNKKQILEAVDLKTVKVSVPEWNGEVFVRTLSGAERDSFEQSIFGEDRKMDMDNVRAKLCALAIVDEKGNRVFDESDVIALGKKSGRALDRIYGVAQTLNGIGEGDIEKLVKNSEQLGQGDGSIST